MQFPRKHRKQHRGPRTLPRALSQGYRVLQRGGGSGDGGVDVRMVDPPTGETWAVQCKMRSRRRVGTAEAAAFVSQMRSQGIRRGVYVTLQGLTKDADDALRQAGFESYSWDELQVLLGKHAERVLPHPFLQHLIEAGLRTPAPLPPPEPSPSKKVTWTRDATAALVAVAQEWIDADADRPWSRILEDLQLRYPSVLHPKHATAGALRDKYRDLEKAGAV